MVEKKFEKDKSCCGNCRYFDKFAVQKREDNLIGACHCNPPIPANDDPYMNDEKVSKLARFPVVLGSWFCGLFENNKGE